MSTKPENMKAASTASTAIAVQGASTAITVQGAGMALDKLMDASQDEGFIPWLTIAQGSSDSVKKNNPEGVRSGDYILAGRRILGKEVRAVAIGGKAEMIAHPYASLDNPETESYVIDDDNWQEIEAAKRARAERQQARLGTNVLLWLPDERTFAAFGFSNTFTKELPDLVKVHRAGLIAVFKTRLVETKRYSWLVPFITGVQATEPVVLPTAEITKAAILQFDAPAAAYREQRPAAPAPSSRPR